MELELWMSVTLWTGLILFATFVELQTNDFVSLAIIAGSIAALISSFSINNAMTQLIIFGSVSIGLSLILIPMLGFVRKGKEWDPTTERLINKVKKIVSYNEATDTYSITESGVKWDVICDKKISLHDEVKVIAVKGNRLQVEIVDSAWSTKIKKGTE